MVVLGDGGVGVGVQAGMAQQAEGGGLGIEDYVVVQRVADGKGEGAGLRRQREEGAWCLNGELRRGGSGKQGFGFRFPF